MDQKQQQNDEAQQNKKTHEEHVKDIGDLVKDIKYGMLTTIEADKSLRSRPMAARQIDEDGTLVFFTYDNAPKCDEVNKDNHVNVSFSEPKSQKYVSLSGQAELSHDRKKMEEVWDPLYKAWFPKGLEEPHIALLKITVDKAEYWNSPNSAVVRVVGLAKALLTGKKADNVGTHERVEGSLANEKGEKKDVDS